ncbi:MAG TPA: efflux RND transporter permease subunit [Candidatus Omnitrophota bacterium]|nr:efflux RND transporter permease subunit [Candidatus Omnitrophota bacterium]
MLEKLIQYFIRRHLLTNLIFLTVIIGGILSWQNIKKEEMPDVTFDRVRISASYPGATAEEVEHFVTKPIEDEIQGIDGVYRVTSSATEGTTNITVEIEKDYPDKDEVITEIRNAVLDVDLPDDVRDDPTVRVFKTAKMAIMDVALYHTGKHLMDTADRKLLQEYAHALENQLLNLPQINSFNKSGYLQEEIQIKVDPAKLIEYEIPISQVMHTVKDNHVRQPAGNIETKNEPKVTLNSQLDTIEKLDHLIIQAGFEGKAIPLKDIAQLQSGFNTKKEIIKVNGHEAVILNVVKNTSYGILNSISAVLREIERFQRNFLQNSPVAITVMDDEATDLRNRLSIIAVNGSIGFFLILFFLFLFLDKKSGFWVAMGIPFTICFTLLAAFLLDYSINNITLAAVIIVMGMVVDDAIVVTENIARLRAQGMSSHDAAVKGTASVFLPVMASVMTTCIAFVPLFFFTGRFGQINRFIPPIIFLMLGSSLLEALIILPGHMHFEIPHLNNYWRRKKHTIAETRAHWFEKVEDAYGGLLVKILPYKMVVLSIFILLLGMSWLIMTQKMKFVMFPNEETREVMVSGEALDDYDRYDTAALTREIEEIIKPFLGREVIGVRTEIARSRRGSGVEENRFRAVIEIVPKEKRAQSADQLIALWKKDIDKIKGLKEMTIQKSRWGQSSGSAIEIIVQENDDGLREQAAHKLAELMKMHQALINVDIERPMPIPEYKIDLKRERIKRLDISAGDISNAFRAALEGTVLYELPKGDEEIDVRLSIIDEAKKDINDILKVPVENRNNYLVPLGDLVNVQQTTTPISISRRDRKRTTTVYADIKPKTGLTPLEIAVNLENNVFPHVTADHPSTTIAFIGEIQDTRESQGDLRKGIILVLFLIFSVLATLFNSLTRPLIIMLAIPFGLVGIILAFWFHGKILFGFFAAIGALGLAGVVINDSIIMLSRLDEEFAKIKCMNSSEINTLISRTAQTRLRAVLLTTLTTVAGLFPTAYGVAGYDAMLADMMLAMAWGLCFGTFITLLLVPCIYSFMQESRVMLKSALGFLK